jgi:histidyl-tRNA synthetase
MIVRRCIEKNMRSTAISFGYQEVATPTFEDAELFIRKSGPEIVDQLYIFRDKGNRELVLRPELTAPVIRFYANELYKQPKPLKIFYEGNCFRYERPQKGRFREFWQFGAELIGTNNPEGIAELLAFATFCLKNLGLKNFELRVGYLEILKFILNDWQIPKDVQSNLMINIDKGDIEALKSQLEEFSIDETKIILFSDLIQSKFKSSEFEEKQKLFAGQFPIIADLFNRFSKVIDCLNKFGIKDCTIDLGIARGLDYYTGIVFEIDVPALGAEKQVCGGGEYSLDELFKLKDGACSGFAIGFDRIVLAYELEGLDAPKQNLDIYISPLSEPGLVKAMEISSNLRGAGYCVDLDIKGRNMSKNLKFASSKMAKFVMFVGENELSEGIALVRDMTTGEQLKIKFEDLEIKLKEIIQ